MAEFDGSIRIVTKIITRDAEESLSSLEYTIKKSAKEIEKLRQKMDALKDQKIPTQEYKKLQEDLAKAKKELSVLVAKQTELEELGVTSGDEWDTLNEKVATASDGVDLIKEKMQSLTDAGKDFVLGQDTEEYAAAARQIKYEEEAIIKAGEHYKRLLSKVPGQFDKMRNSAKKAFNAVTDGTKKSSKSLSGSLKTILKYSLGIRSLYALMNKLRSAVKEGFANLAQFSDPVNKSISMLMSSLTQLKNSLATAFAPIVTAVAPLLKSLIDMLSQAATQVGMFIAALTGAKSFTKAVSVQQDYAKSLNKTAGAAKKAAGALAKFDDLDVLQKQDDGGGGAADLSPSDMFEEVPIDQNVPKWLDGILERLRELRDISMDGFLDGLGDWEYRWESIKESAVSIKGSLIDIWTDPAVLSAQYEYQNSVAYMLGSVEGAAASIGLTIATNLVGGIAKYLEQNKERIKESIVSMFDIGAEINQLIADLSQAFAFIFEAFASDDAHQLTANLIGIFMDGVMGTFEIIGKLSRDILNIFIKPFVDNKEEFREALEGFLGVLSEVTGTIKQGIDDTFDKLNEVYDEHFKPFYDSVAQIFTDLSGLFLEFWDERAKPILDEWAARFDDLWKKHIQPVINSIIGLLGSVADVMKFIWESILQPIIWWMIEYMLPYVLNAVDTIVKVIFVAVGLISDIISGVFQILGGFIDFIVGAFTLDLKKVCNGIIKMVGGVRDYIKGIINAILGFFETMVNSFIDGINSIINTLESLASVKNPITGEVIWQLDIPDIPYAKFPRLANGAVIRGGNPFMAVLGDQPAGHTNIEAPLATIEKAVENVLGRQGYGNEPVPVTINLNYDGETFARVSLSDILSEAARQGLDVDVLGVT